MSRRARRKQQRAASSGQVTSATSSSSSTSHVGSESKSPISEVKSSFILRSPRQSGSGGMNVESARAFSTFPQGEKKGVLRVVEQELSQEIPDPRKVLDCLNATRTRFYNRGDPISTDALLFWGVLYTDADELWRAAYLLCLEDFLLGCLKTPDAGTSRLCDDWHTAASQMIAAIMRDENVSDGSDTAAVLERFRSLVDLLCPVASQCLVWETLIADGVALFWDVRKHPTLPTRTFPDSWVHSSHQEPALSDIAYAKELVAVEGLWLIALRQLRDRGESPVLRQWVTVSYFRSMFVSLLVITGYFHMKNNATYCVVGVREILKQIRILEQQRSAVYFHMFSIVCEIKTHVNRRYPSFDIVAAASTAVSMKDWVSVALCSESIQQSDRALVDRETSDKRTEAD